MGTFNTSIVQSDGDERAFLTAIYTHIMGAWGGITCSVKNGEDAIISPATASDFLWSQNTISYIEFGLDGNSSIRFTSRPRDNADLMTREYTIAFIVNGVTIVNRGGTENTNGKSGIVFCGTTSYVSSGLNPSASGNRKYILSEYLADNVKIFWIASKDAATYKDSLVNIVLLRDSEGDWYYGGSNSGFNPEVSTIYDSTGTDVSTKSSLFSYAASVGYIDYIKESMYVSGGVKSFSTPYIYDCSTVTFGSTITLNDGNYMAIGEHSLVKL